MIRAVLDTNVVVSGILHPGGSPGRLLHAALGEQRFLLVTSLSLLEEVWTVLQLCLEGEDIRQAVKMRRTLEIA